jgi:molybdopterin/thiamine biosynthesis adenylyltransferase
LSLAPRLDQERLDQTTAMTTQQEAAPLDPRLYDRQLRVWGVAAQKKLSASRVLVCGSLNGLAAELTKDLVLAGIAALYLDDRHADVPLNAADLTANCLIGPNKIGTNRVQAFTERLKAMNPLVNIHAASESVVSEHSTADVKQYDLICAIGLTQQQLLQLNARTRAAHVPLIAGQVMGRYGYACSDLLAHQYKRKLPDKEIEEQREIVFPSYAQVAQCKVDRQTHKLFLATQALLHYLDAHPLPRSESEMQALIETKNSVLSSRGADPALVSDSYLR